MWPGIHEIIQKDEDPQFQTFCFHLLLTRTFPALIVPLWSYEGTLSYNIILTTLPSILNPSFEFQEENRLKQLALMWFTPWILGNRHREENASTWGQHNFLHFSTSFIKDREKKGRFLLWSLHVHTSSSYFTPMLMDSLKNPDGLRVRRFPNFSKPGSALVLEKTS